MQARKLEQTDLLTNHLVAIQYLSNSQKKDKFQQRELGRIIFDKYPLYQHIVEVANYQQPVDSYKIEDFISQTNAHLSKYNLEKSYTECLWRKLYSQIVIECILQNNIISGQHYLTKLDSLIAKLKDVQQIIHTFFGFTSLTALQSYKVDFNNQYKYNSTVHVLFYYILSQINLEQSKVLIDKCKDIIQKQFNNYPAKRPLIHKIYEEIKHDKQQKLLKRVISFLHDKQKAFQSKASTNAIFQASKLRQIVLCYIKNKWSVQIKNREDLQQLRDKKSNQINLLIAVLKASPQIIHQNVLQTNFVKKMMRCQSEIDKEQSQRQRIIDYINRVLKRGLGSLDKFKRLKEGMFLRKCNFHNSKINLIFVYLGQDGMYWGSSRMHCLLKYKWQKIKGIIFGAIASNILKFAVKKKEQCFSLVLKDRTIDFICESREQVHLWLKGITFILNQHKSRKAQPQANIKLLQEKIVSLKGLTLWSQLFMSMRKQGQPWQLKASGLYSFPKGNGQSIK